MEELVTEVENKTKAQSKKSQESRYKKQDLKRRLTFNDQFSITNYQFSITFYP